MDRSLGLSATQAGVRQQQQLGSCSEVLASRGSSHLKENITSRDYGATTFRNSLINENRNTPKENIQEHTTDKVVLSQHTTQVPTTPGTRTQPTLTPASEGVREDRPRGTSEKQQPDCALPSHVTALLTFSKRKRSDRTQTQCSSCWREGFLLPTIYPFKYATVTASSQFYAAHRLPAL